MGSLFRVPLSEFDESAGKRIALVPSGGIPLPELDSGGDVVLVLGAEREGLPAEVLERCDETRLDLAAGRRRVAQRRHGGRDRALRARATRFGCLRAPIGDALPKPPRLVLIPGLVGSALLSCPLLPHRRPPPRAATAFGARRRECRTAPRIVGGCLLAPSPSIVPERSALRKTLFQTGPEKRPAPLRGPDQRIRRAGFAFVRLVQPALRFGIAPSSSDRSVEVSTYSRSVLGARRNLCQRRHRIKTPPTTILSQFAS